MKQRFVGVNSEFCLKELKMKHKLTFKRVKRILELDLADHQEFLANPNLYFAWVGAVGMINDFF